MKIGWAITLAIATFAVGYLVADYLAFIQIEAGEAGSTDAYKGWGVFMTPNAPKAGLQP
jgi:hypothetical protein